MVLSLSGTMTMGNRLQVLEETIEELTKNPSRIVLDMSRITYLDSSAIGVLIATLGKVRNSGGQIRLAGVIPRIATIFKMTGVDKLLSMDATTDESVSALAGSS